MHKIFEFNTCLLTLTSNFDSMYAEEKFFFFLAKQIEVKYMDKKAYLSFYQSTTTISGKVMYKMYKMCILF